MIAATASADGTLDVTLDGAGSGTVTSTSQEASGFGTSIATPAQIDCATGAAAPHDICSTSFDFDFFGFGHDGFVTLTATPDPGHLFDGWAQTGASSSARCTTPPAEDPTCQVNLNGTPGPAATVTATFVPVPDPPVVTTGDSTPGTVGHLATLEGAVNPGGADVTKCFFEYGLTTEYGRTAQCTPAPAALGDGEDDVAVSATTGPLEPHTVYHYRLVAENLGGASQGDDRTLTSGSGPSDDCPNADIRAAQGITVQLLPDCMALEMVTPPKKLNMRAMGPHVSADGSRIKFKSQAVVAGTQGSLSPLFGDVYVAERSEGGWSSFPTLLDPQVFSGWNLSDDLARSFNSDLSSWFVLSATAPQFQAGVGQVRRGRLGAGAYEPLSPLLEPAGSGGLFVQKQSNVEYGALQGASGDHSRMYFEMGMESETYLPGDPLPAGSGFDKNAYVALLDSAGEPSLQLLARDDDGLDGDDRAWGANCGARLGGRVDGADIGWRNQGAVSADGSRVYFSTRPSQPEAAGCDPNAHKLRILERRETPTGVDVSELFGSECEREAPDPLCSTVDGDDLYQGASVDQSKVYFTTNRQLADSDLDGGGDLYLYDAAKPDGERLTQVSAGEANAAHPTVGSGAGVRNGVTAIAGDGSRVYFVADGVLTTEPNPAGDSADEYAAGDPKLYVWDAESGQTRFIGALHSGDSGELWAGSGTFLNRAYPVPAVGQDEAGNEIGGDGRTLLFQSRAALTPDDTDGGSVDVFRYDATAASPTLERITKAAPGGSDNGAFDVTSRGPNPAFAARVGTAATEDGRWVSEDGATIVFRTAEALVSDDLNDGLDAYLWRDGALVRLPGTKPPTAVASGGNEYGEYGADRNTGPVLSHDGDVVAFTAFDRLLPEDFDSAPDVYAARVGGGFPRPAEPVACTVLADACQGAGAGQLGSPVASDGVTGGGNAALRARKRLALVRPSAAQRRRAARYTVLRLRVRTNSAGTIMAVARGRIGKRPQRVARDQIQLRRAGTARLDLRLNRAAKRRLKAGRNLRLSILVRSPGARPRTMNLRLPGARS